MCLYEKKQRKKREKMYNFAYKKSINLKLNLIKHFYRLNEDVKPKFGSSIFSRRGDFILTSAIKGI